MCRGVGFVGRSGVDLWRRLDCRREINKINVQMITFGVPRMTPEGGGRSDG